MTENIKNGVDLHIIDAEKFKTNTISVFFNIPIEKFKITEAALLPAVMKRGTMKHRTMAEISKYLDSLYSAVLRAGVRQKGDGEVVYFSIEYIRDRFIGDSIIDKAVDLLREFIFEPLIENDSFDNDYLSGEKENLKNTIEGLINDKREYTDFKCREAMFPNDGYGMYEAGSVEDLPKIDGECLYDFYKELLSDAKIDVFAGGSFDESQKDIVRGLADMFGERDAEYVKTEYAKPRGDKAEINKIVEEIPVVQSKLCIGMRCGVAPTEKAYYALMLGGCIFGGSPFSKLFNNVREKLSLAYYATARTERLKSTMFISCGIEIANYKAAYDEILVQLKKMQTGEFDDSELENAKLYMCSRFTSMKDSLRTMEDYSLSQAIMSNNGGIDDLIERTNAVTRDEIVEVFGNLKFDTVYFLKGSAGGKNNEQ